MEAIGEKYDFTLKTPIADISEEALNVILYGSNEVFKVKAANSNASSYSLSFEGIVNFISRQNEEADSKALQKWANSFTQRKACPTCNGARLKKEALHFRLHGKNIAEVSGLNLSETQKWFDELPSTLNEKQ